MKYQVQIKYTNPMHEHVTLRRRVESVTRLVEAANEQEALNRAANQQRSLGFMIKEAAVVKSDDHAQVTPDPEHGKKKKKIVGNDDEKTDIASAGGVKEAAGGTESYPLLKKGEKLKPMKIGEGFDPEPKDIAAHLVDKHGKGKVTKDHVDAYEKDRDSNKGIDKEAVMKHVQKMSEDVESVDEAQKKLKPSYWKAEWRLGTQSEVDKNNKKIYDKLAKTDPDKAKKFHDNLMKIRKEEVEQVDEARFVTKTELKARENEKKLKTTDAYKNHVARIKKVSHLKKMVDEIHDNMQADFWRPKGGNKSNPIDDATHKRLLTRINSLKEEVEQIDELNQKTLKSYINKSIKTGRADDPKGDHNLYKATSKVARNQATSTLKKKVSNLKYTSMAKHKNPYEYQVSRDELANRKVSEEFEQVDEANMRFDYEAAARPKSSDVKNFLNRDKNPRAAAASKKYIRRMTKLGGLGPNQTKKDTEAHMKAHFEEVELSEASKEGKDVMRNMRAGLKSMDLRHGVDSDKRDAGYKMSPAVRKAQAASDALSKREKKPQAGTLAAKKARNAAEKMVNKAKGNANKIDVEPSMEPGKPNA